MILRERKTGGYATLYDPDAQQFNGIREFDTLRCQHHGGLVRFKGFERLHDKGTLCRRCGGFLCPECAALGPCDGVTILNCEQRLERLEGRAQRAVEEEVPLASRGYLLLPEGFTPRPR